MTYTALKASKHRRAVGSKPGRRDPQELGLLPTARSGGGLLTDVLDVQQFVTEKLFKGDSLAPVSQQNLGKICEPAQTVAAQQQLLILS
jgi:hypothetical protein